MRFPMMVCIIYIYTHLSEADFLWKLAFVIDMSFGGTMRIKLLYKLPNIAFLRYHIDFLAFP